MSATAPRRGSFPRRQGRPQQPVDDTEQVRNLRSKYSNKLEMIRELFPDWTDEDLLFALQDAGGDVESAVVRISEGQVEQFSSVKSKKQAKKEAAPAPTNASSSAGWAANNTTSSSTPASFARGRGGHVASDRGGRGGRGGVLAVRGARGGRGGFRGAVGGRGGGITPQVNGHAAKSPETTVETTAAPTFAPIATPTSGTSWAAALSKSNKANGASAPAAAPAADIPAAAPALTETAKDTSLGQPEPAAEVEPAQPAAPTNETATTAGALSSTATETIPAVKVPAPAKSAPKPAGMSWAQIARKSEAPKPAAAAESEQKAAEPAAVNEEVKDAVEQASWSVDEPAAAAAQDIAPEQPAAVEQPVETQFAEPIAAQAPQVSAPAAQAEVAEAPAAAFTGPPGLASKPAARSGLSQRAIQRSRQEAPVVMPGGNSQLDKLGVQFGSLNFLAGEDGAAEPAADEAAAPEPAKALEAQASSPSASRTQPSLHERLAQSQAPAAQQQQDSYSQQQAGAYSGYKSDAFDNSTYSFSQQSQQQQPQQASQEPAQSQQQDHIAGYGGFGSLGNQQQSQQSQNQAAQPQQGLQDYSAMYGGLDTQRLAHFYGGGYDQTSSSFGQRVDEKNQPQQSASQQQPLDQHQGSGQQAQQQQHHQAQSAPGLHQQQQAPQQQFPGIMPYYYPNYYVPHQFQHYGQPAAGYGQYPMYGQPAGQPQHPSKSGTPANIASPYSQAPQSADTNAYGAQGHYGQTPSSANLSASYDAQGFSRGMQGMPGLGGGGAAVSDYSKIYGGAIPGLGGFLGGAGSSAAPPSQSGGMGAGAGSGNSAASGTPHLGSQQKAGASSGSALDSYRQFDGKAAGQTGGAGQVNRSQAQGQLTPQQQAAQHQQQQQQQQYYHQYGAYGHQANNSASYGNYPYARQYWGQ